MNTSITVADCRANLFREVDASNPNNPTFLLRLNEARERLFYSGKWKGLYTRASYPTPNGYLSLAYQHAGLLSFRYRRCPRPIFTQFYPFVESGPGEIDNNDYFPGTLFDLGDGFVTHTDISTAGALRVAITDANDAAKSIRLFGKDENGNTIYDTSGVEGITITTANPTADTTVQFSEVTGIQAPVMEGYWTLSVVNGSDVTSLSTYTPGERVPRYRRYRTGQLEEAVQVMVSLRCIPVVAETDWVLPGNMSALRCALQALQFEAGGEYDRADASIARAVNYLNQEARIERAGAIPTINFISEMSRGVSIGG